MELQDLEARRNGTTHRVAVGREQGLEVALLERARRDAARIDRLLGRRDGAPGLVAAVEVSLRERPVPVPGARHARLASGVRELQCRDRALAFHEAADLLKARDVGVI